MRMGVKLAVVVAVGFFSTLGTAYAKCKTEACREATAWKAGYTAVVLDDNISGADYRAALDTITRSGGIVAIEAERVILGWVPLGAAGKVRQARGVTAVLYDLISSAARTRCPRSVFLMTFRPAPMRMRSKRVSPRRLVPSQVMS